MVGDSIKYPIYIVSKGRWENPITAKYFLKENIPFKIAVEPQEFENYKKTIPEKNILVLPFSNLGLGSYPARNYCWENSIKNGFKKHWLFDDNIYGIGKSIKGIRRKNSIKGLVALKNSEIFFDKYTKLAIGGFNYSYFIGPWVTKPFNTNVHVYSGMLITNEIPYRWRLKYNEDVDLCLQALNDGWNTILLNIYYIRKVSTVAKLKGGNQTELYKGNAPEKKLLKAKSLEAVWPQYVETRVRFGRIHHYVNWKKHFKQPLKRNE